MYYPLNYDAITWAEGHNPPAHVKSYNNESFIYWERALFQRACSVFDFTLPEEWQGERSDFFYWLLFRFGYLMIAYDDKFGHFFQPGSLGGFDFFYQPVWCQVSNPKLQKRYTIHEDCELLKLTPDYLGAWDIISRYAKQLSTLDVAINTNIINSKLAYILGAKNKNAAEALKTLVDRINSGEPTVYYDKVLAGPKADDSPLVFTPVQKIKENYIVMDQLRDLQTILNAFDNEVGIPTVPYQKAERMVTAEAESREADAVSRVTVWKKTLDASLVNVNKMFPELNISVKVRWADDGDRENNADRNAELSADGEPGSVRES